MTKRVQAANHLGHLLSAARRDEPPGHEEVAVKMTQTQQPWLEAQCDDAVGKVGSRLTELQANYYAAARLLRHAGLPRDCLWGEIQLRRLAYRAVGCAEAS
jgi:hypothetical protein